MVETKKPKEGVIFFCASPKAKFAGLEKERKFSDGSIEQHDVPIIFDNCLFIAKTQREIKFMRKITEGDSISSTITKECKDMEEWNMFRAARDLKRAGMSSVDIQHALNDDKFDFDSDAKDQLAMPQRATG
ncbi:MAG: hypothetical protein KAR42_17625 [candidate division Zixibacteria bacterium]|nr:hypothetical protein [candidate division Zixibacteria bacterium]